MRLYIPDSMRLSGGNMMIRPGRFNTYLLLTCTLAALLGCGTTDPEKKKAREEAKQTSTLRIHLEADVRPAKEGQGGPVYRENPILFQIDGRPILTEANVASAKLIESLGSFAIIFSVSS